MNPSLPFAPRRASPLTEMRLPRTAIVTAGGTEELIDDVRVVTNLSSGTFGIALARELAGRGIETTVLCSPKAEAMIRPSDSLHVLPFRTARDLEAALRSFAGDRRPDVVMMAAAVSDYSPVPVSGKLTSEPEELTLRMRRNPKILDTLRELFGVETFIAGFKLTSGLSAAELMEKAVQQTLRARTNLTVANDLARIRERSGHHPVLLATPEGGAIPVAGRREEVARSIVDFVLQRYSVRWFTTRNVEGGSQDAPDHSAAAVSTDLLAFAKAAHLLTGTPGNLSVRAAGSNDQQSVLIVSPRQVNKSALTPSSLVKATVDLVSREVRCETPSIGSKSSIDTGMQGILYNLFPQLEALLHFHPGHQLVIPSCETTFPYPCGTVEEASEIYHAVTAAQPGSVENFLVKLIHHGFLLGLERGGPARLAAAWEDVVARHTEHLTHIGANEVAQQLTRYPVFQGPHIVGLLARNEAEKWSSLFLHPDSRNGRLGEQLVDQLIARGDTIAVHDDCQVVLFYTRRGYRSDRQSSVQLLTPPSRRDDLREAASVCLVNVAEKRVLLTERAVEPWRGIFCFPGGGLDEGETPLAAARRELREEVEINIDALFPQAERTLYVGSEDGARAYRVSNFQFALQKDLPFSITAEVGHRTGWYDRERALALPIGTGTRRILRALIDSGTL